MKRALTAFLISITLGYTSFAQETNKMDANGKRHGIWKGTYDNGRPRYEGAFDHGKETGTFKFYDDAKISTVMATRVFDKDGSCYTTFFEPTGTKVSEGKEVNRLQEGPWKYYHYKSNALMSTETYKAGKLNGVKKVFFPNGAVAEEVNYINGLKEGAYKKYTEKCTVIEESAYKNDAYEGKAVYRTTEGKVASEGVYKNGKKTGIWKFYNGDKVTEKNMSAKPSTGKAKEKTKN